MKAAHIVAPRQIEIVDVEEPDISSAPEGTIIIKTELTAICGSDMPHFVLERPASAYPLNIGMSIHECIGVVVDSKSRRFKVGDEVLALPRGIGGLAEYFVSHEAATVPLSPFHRKDCILMAQPLGTVVWACRKLGNILNQDTVVVGQGPMGLLMNHMLSNLGAKTVIAVEPVEERLAVSQKMRATHVISAVNQDPIAEIARITAGRMADLVVEIVGHQTETINQCLDMVKRGGTILAFGVPDDEVYGFNYSQFFRHNVRLIGTVGPDVQNDFPLAMDMITQGRFDVSPIITHHLPFTEVQRGFEMFMNRTEGAIKIVLEYD